MAWTEGGEGLILRSSSYSKMVLTKGVDQSKRSGDEEEVQLWPRRGDDGAEDDQEKQRRRWSLIDSRERQGWCCRSDQERSRERWWCCWIPRPKEKSMLLDLREEDDGANKRRREGINRWRHALNQEERKKATVRERRDRARRRKKNRKIYAKNSSPSCPYKATKWHLKPHKKNKILL